MKKVARIAAILLLVSLASCNFPLNGTALTPTPVPVSKILLGNSLQPTLTPFQQIPPTPTPGQSLSSTTAVPAETEVSQLPTADFSQLTQAPGQVNILILGSDIRASSDFRTDVIMLLSLNPNRGTATLTSFPRDLYVSIPGMGMDRINTAQEYGGFALTAATFANNFGVQPQYYMMTNFSGFKGIIDTLGGIDVNAAEALKDKCSVRSAEDGMGNCTIPAGVNHMDGELSLWYVRSRYSTSDFDRTRRAQEVLTAIFQKLISLNALNHVPDLYGQFKTSIETNIPLTEIVSLLPLASKIATDPAILRHYAIGANETNDYIVPDSGAWVLLPDSNAILAIMQQALN